MALIVRDRIFETTTSTGTGTILLNGAFTGFKTFSSVCSVGDTFYYLIEAVDSSGIPTGDWETGIGTYSATDTITRTTVKDSSNSGSAVSFSAGTKRVAIVNIASAANVPEAYSATASTQTSISPAPTSVTAVTGATVTVAASLVSRTFTVSGMITWNSSTHGMRGSIMVDGTRVWPSTTPANSEINPIATGDGAYGLTFAGVIVTIPGDNATHTISLAWSAQSSTAAITLQERTIAAIRVA
jgi:hypothetical protein